MGDSMTQPARDTKRADSRRGRSSTAFRSLYAQTVETIGSRIVGGRYTPGTALPIDELEQDFGISKSVLREALRVLASKGLIDTKQKRGTVVSPRSSWNLLDADMLRWQGGEPDAAFLANLAEVRRIVEPAAAQLAATRRSEADLEALRAALQEMSDAASDPGAAVEADLAFHRALLDAAHNELLSRMEVVIEAGLRARDVLVHSGEHLPDWVPVHRGVFDAIEAGAGADAARAVEALLEQASVDVEAVSDKRSRRPRARRSPGKQGNQEGADLFAHRAE